MSTASQTLLVIVFAALPDQNSGATIKLGYDSSFPGTLYLDEYGKMVGLAQAPGSIEILCVLSKDLAVSVDHFVEIVDDKSHSFAKVPLDPNNKEVMEREPDGDELWMVKLRVPIDNTTVPEASTLRCRYDGGVTSNESFKLTYRLCSDEEAECQEDCDDGKKFCIVTASGKKSCANFDATICDNDEKNVQHFEPCPSDSKTKRRLYREVILMNRTHRNVRIDVGPNDPSTHNLTCLIMSKTSPESRLEFKRPQFEIPENLFNLGTHVYLLDCAFWPYRYIEGEITARLAYYLVIIEGTATVLNVTNDGKTATLKCLLRPGPPSPFRVSYTWAAEKGGPSTETSEQIAITTADQYQCTATVTYKTCRPHRRFSKSIISEFAPISFDRDGDGGGGVVANIALIAFGLSGRIVAKIMET